MILEIKVPSMVCQSCAETITKAIQQEESHAKVEVNLDSKIVKLETQASEESIEQIITAVGHTVAQP